MYKYINVYEYILVCDFAHYSAHSKQWHSFLRVSILLRLFLSSFSSSSFLFRSHCAVRALSFFWGIFISCFSTACRMIFPYLSSIAFDRAHFTGCTLDFFYFSHTFVSIYLHNVHIHTSTHPHKQYKKWIVCALKFVTKVTDLSVFHWTVKFKHL